MEPNSTAPTSPSLGAPFVEYIRTQRQNAGMLFAILALLFLVLTAFLALKAYRAAATPEKPADQKQKENPFDRETLQPTKPPSDAGDSLRTGYMFGWLGTLGAFLAVGSMAGWLLLAPPAPTESRQRADVRVAILAVGAALGTLAILFGIIFFYLWRDSLSGWLDKEQMKEARWVLIPILMIVVGAGVIFLAIQPARAEERSNAPIRRTVYWTNFGLAALLLLVAFVIANVVFSLKVTNKLDTTATGFYSLSANTRNLLTHLDEPMTAYAVNLQGQDRITNDIRLLLTACQEASDGKFTVKFLSGVSTRNELNALRQKYPQLDLALKQGASFGNEEDSGVGAVLLTTGEDEKRHAVIPSSEFSTVTTSSNPQNRQRVFQGEARLYKEIAFLSDSRGRPVVYFTQGNQELDISGTPDGRPVRSAARLKAYLGKNYLDVRPLTFAPDKPSVPADADIVVVADPMTPLPDPAVAALRAFMNNPAKKGKLVVFVGAHAGPNRKMIKTGLEPLLKELNVQLGTKFLYNLPNEDLPLPDRTLAAFSKSAEQNPILQAIIKVSPFLVFGEPRLVEPVTTNPTNPTNPTYQATDLLLSYGRNWTEDEPITDYRAVILPMLRSLDAQKARGVTSLHRPLAVTVTEGGTARAAVFGSSYFISDEIFRTRSEAAPLSFELIGVTLDWLRDRPPISAAGVESKTYSQYRFPQPAAVDKTRILFLPLGLAFLCVVGLGAGVWVIRRR